MVKNGAVRKAPVMGETLCEGVFVSFTRKIAALAAASLLLGGFSVLGAQNAGAVSARHKILFSGNQNAAGTTTPAIETKAKITFTCNATTGAYNVVVKNVSVIGGDQTILESAPPQLLRQLTIFVGTDRFNVPLTQNAKTELYDANQTNILFNKADCSTGAQVIAGGRDSGDLQSSYLDVGPLS
jgi:hypothetical protein